MLVIVVSFNDDDNDDYRLEYTESGVVVDDNTGSGGSSIAWNTSC